MTNLHDIAAENAEIKIAVMAKINVVTMVEVAGEALAAKCMIAAEAAIDADLADGIVRRMRNQHGWADEATIKHLVGIAATAAHGVYKAAQ